jgi:glycine/D-amino acid oxidase-like deaminating enzyme
MFVYNLFFFFLNSQGDLYICGCGGSDYVRGDRLRQNGDCARAELVLADPKRVAAATTSLKSMTSIGDRKPDIEQACMRPCTTDGNPVMGGLTPQ